MKPSRRNIIRRSKFTMEQLICNIWAPLIYTARWYRISRRGVVWNFKRRALLYYNTAGSIMRRKWESVWGPDSEPAEYFYVIVEKRENENALLQRVLSMKRASRMNDSCFLSPVTTALVRALSLMSGRDPRCASRDSLRAGTTQTGDYDKSEGGQGRGGRSGDKSTNGKKRRKPKGRR